MFLSIRCFFILCISIININTNSLIYLKKVFDINFYIYQFSFNSNVFILSFEKREEPKSGICVFCAFTDIFYIKVYTVAWIRKRVPIRSVTP